MVCLKYHGAQLTEWSEPDVAEVGGGGGASVWRYSCFKTEAGDTLRRRRTGWASTAQDPLRSIVLASNGESYRLVSVSHWKKEHNWRTHCFL